MNESYIELIADMTQCDSIALLADDVIRIVTRVGGKNMVCEFARMDHLSDLDRAATIVGIYWEDYTRAVYRNKQHPIAEIFND